MAEDDVGEKKTPRDYGLMHDEFRPYQEETIGWAIYGESGVSILEAPTGSGKTAVARALGSQSKTVALVRTKALQEENYDMGYGFIPLYGRANYPCVYEKAKPGAKADSCAFSEEGMDKCPQFARCPYAQQKEAAKRAKMATLNYAYWLHVQSKWPPLDNLVLDEAHELSAITLEWAGCTVTQKDKDEWELPAFPILRSGGSASILTKAAPVEEKAVNWLNAAKAKVQEAYTYFNSMKDDEGARKKARKAELFGKKLRSTIDALEAAPKDWFIRSGPNARPSDRVSSWGFVARPLTARHHFGLYFLGEDRKVILMSATIGSIEAFAQELGIKEYSFRTVPSNWPASTRPVVALDVPRMGQKSTEKDWLQQAEQIAKAIKDCPSDWNGIVHVTAIEEATRLANRLAKLGLQDRVHVAKKGPTNEMVADWRYRMKKKPGSILISWALWEGYNGVDEKINIAAKTPYPYLGDPYEVERRNYNGSFFLQRAAWQLEQGLGRTRRGNPGDYDSDGERRGLVAIADGGYKWLRKYFSAAFMESVVEVK